MELITSYGTIFLILACVFGLFMAWGIGANDVANAMGTSVGSGAITIKQAVLIAAIFEFAGAFLAGGAVTKTIRKGIGYRTARFTDLRYVSRLVGCRNLVTSCFSFWLACFNHAYHCRCNCWFCRGRYRF